MVVREIGRAERPAQALLPGIRNGSGDPVETRRHAPGCSAGHGAVRLDGDGSAGGLFFGAIAKAQLLKAPEARRQ
jgi:hypothetical protein